MKQMEIHNTYKKKQSKIYLVDLQFNLEIEHHNSVLIDNDNAIIGLKRPFIMDLTSGDPRHLYETVSVEDMYSLKANDWVLTFANGKPDKVYLWAKIPAGINLSGLRKIVSTTNRLIYDSCDGALKVNKNNCKRDGCIFPNCRPMSMSLEKIDAFIDGYNQAVGHTPIKNKFFE